jgi:hypothetical protein
MTGQRPPGTIESLAEVPLTVLSFAWVALARSSAWRAEGLAPPAR